MQKRSHLLLAQSLIAREHGFPARRYQLAFLLGSVEPDCNPFSYLKGSMRHKLFGGHTYANAKPFINRRIRWLQSRTRWDERHYYALGQLTHYVADAFTWPHNPHFPGVGWEHHVYETALRLALSERLSTPQPRRPELPDVSATLPQDLENLHKRYLTEENPGLATDMAYILKASDLLVAGCRPALRTVYQLPPAFAGQESVGNFA